jgi:glycine/D-amino acid oxidase-like deaminating enzyme/nitrite reductase/ring-hydroxylating ferredoxin subunit
MITPDHGIGGRPYSYWLSSAGASGYPALANGLKVDVAVVGGGIAGMTAALLLKRLGLTVAVIEAGRIAGLATGHTTAHISAAATPNYYRKLIDKFGEGSAKTCARSVLDSIEKIDELVKAYRIDCDLARSTEYLYGAGDQDWDDLREEGNVEARLGLPVSFEDIAPLPFMTHGALRYRDQAEFHPVKYVQGLAAALSGDGCHVFEGTRVRAIVEDGMCTVRTDRGTVTARAAVIATGSPISNLGLLTARMTVRRSYVLGIKAADRFPEHAMFYSTEAPCHYIRSTPSGTLLVGGEDHPTGEGGDTRQYYARLERFCRVHFHVRSVEHSWSTQDMYPFDLLPFIGLLPGSKHQYVATGFKGTGMTYGTLSGMILAELIAKGSSPYESLYSPMRVDLRASGIGLLKRNAHVAEMFARDRLQSPGSEPGLEAGRGGLIEFEGGRAAAYRDQDGALHAVSPMCKHMGCYVRWNEGERTWDCPCHGSRYDVDGRVISAPTTRELSPRGRPRDR